jgi:hypothetical protein
VRKALTAIGTPIAFSHESGHFRSALAGRSLDKHGRPRPWYTVPMIEFLEAKDFTGRRVLEWGAGQSTLWWAAHADSVVSFDCDRDWYAEIKKRAPANVTLHLVPSDLNGCDELIQGAFDVIVVDGLDRAKAVEISVARITEDGCILVDNSEGFWGPPPSYPIMDTLRRHRFSRVDFYGYTPGGIRPHCTSLAFRGHCFLLDGGENPVRRVPR